MPERIQQIETILQLKLRLAPADQGGWLPPVMRVMDKQPQYALDAEGNITGLNLAETGLTDKKWQQILALTGLAEQGGEGRTSCAARRRGPGK